VSRTLAGTLLAIAIGCAGLAAAAEAPPAALPPDGVLSQAVAERLDPVLPLQVPVSGVRREALVDTFDDRRGTDRRHEALDIPAPRGTPVTAVDDGEVMKLFLSEPGGLTVYQFDRTRSVAYYYAHLDRYADGLAEGQVLHRGDAIGAVGSTGNADPEAPHLHFAVFELGPQRRWWKGRAVNPLPLLVRPGP
jgi:murein DD-endopeptidase MepM/ murein hydrolase activator NlpD